MCGWYVLEVYVCVACVGRCVCGVWGICMCVCVGGCIVGWGVTQTTRSSWVKQMALAHNASTLPLTHFALCVHRWSHEYQEATIEKIIRFLQGRPSQDSSAGSDTSLEGATPMGLP